MGGDEGTDEGDCHTSSSLANEISNESDEEVSVLLRAVLEAAAMCWNSGHSARHCANRASMHLICFFLFCYCYGSSSICTMVIKPSQVSFLSCCCFQSGLWEVLVY